MSEPLSFAKRRKKEKQSVTFSAKPMGKQVGETEQQHRGFLLWAMQSPDLGRNQRAVARAVSVTAPSIKNWMKRWEWEERAKNITADTEAYQLYKNLYFPTIGNAEIMAVQSNIKMPEKQAGQAVVDRSVAETISDTIESAAKKSETLLEKETERKHLMLLDAALGYVAQGIKNGEIKRSLRDIPMLLEMREQLTSKGHSEQQALVVESIRVRDAKANGTDIIEAMYEDAEELSAILKALRSRGSVVQNQGESNE